MQAEAEAEAERRRSPDAQLVVAGLRDVADPRERRVAGALVHLQVAHLQAGEREVGQLEAHADRRLRLERVAALRRRQRQVRAHRLLLAALRARVRVRVHSNVSV